MNNLRALVAIILAALPGCLWAQTRLVVTTKDSIYRFRQASTCHAVAVVSSDFDGKDSWSVEKFDLDLTNGTFGNPDSLAIGLSEVYDTWYDTTTQQIAIIADGSRQDSGITYPFILGRGATKFSRQVRTLSYKAFDRRGYVGYQSMDTTLIYVRYDGTEINFRNDAPFNTLGADKLGAMESLGLAILHDNKGFFLYNIPLQTRYSPSYPVNPRRFQSNVYIAPHDRTNTLLILNKNQLDSSSKFEQITLRNDGYRPFLDMNTAPTQHILQFDSSATFLLPDYGSDKSDTLQGYPFEDSILVRIRRCETDTFYCVDVPKRVMTRISNRDSIGEIVAPFYKGYFVTKSSTGTLFLSDLSNNNMTRLSSHPFKAIFPLHKPNDDNYYFLCLTGESNSLYVFRIRIDKNGNCSVSYIDEVLDSKPIVHAFQGNTLLVKSSAGWKFMDGIVALDRTSTITIDGKPQKWPWYVFPIAPVDNIRFQSRTPFAGRQTLLVEYHLPSSKEAKYKLLTIEHLKPSPPKPTKSPSTGNTNH